MLAKTYLEDSADVVVGGAISAVDDLPAVELGRVRRGPEVEEGEDVDAGRSFIEKQSFPADVEGRRFVVQK